MCTCRFCGVPIICLEGIGWVDFRTKENHGTFDICMTDGYGYSHYPSERKKIAPKSRDKSGS